MGQRVLILSPFVFSRMLAAQCDEAPQDLDVPRLPDTRPAAYPTVRADGLIEVPVASTSWGPTPPTVHGPIYWTPYVRTAAPLGRFAVRMDAFYQTLQKIANDGMGMSSDQTKAMAGLLHQILHDWNLIRKEK